MKKQLSIFFSILFFALLFALSANSLPLQDKDEKYFQNKEVDQKIKITFKPRPPSSRKCDEDSGKVALRVYFHKSEKIEKAEIIRPSSCDDFDREAIYAAKQIKFKAAIKAGQSVSTVSIIEYNWQKF